MNANELKKNSAAETGVVTKSNPLKELFAGKTVFLGIHEKAGDFKNDKGEQITFHNFYISVSSETDTNSATVSNYGTEASVLKVKADDICGVLGIRDLYSEFNAENWLYHEIDLRFDKKGNVKSIRLVG
mgnify:CR=1 FL=1